MYEPIQAAVRTPTGGWSRCAHRVELVGVKQLPEAIYELATLARRHHVGYVAEFLGHDLYAYPHQEVGAIARAWQRMRELDGAGICAQPKPDIERWTAARKAGLVLALQLGLIARLDALTTYGLTEDELGAWEASFQAMGVNGLKTGHARAAA